MLGTTAWTKETGRKKKKKTRSRSATTSVTSTSSFHERGNGLHRRLPLNPDRRAHHRHPSLPSFTTRRLRPSPVALRRGGKEVTAEAPPPSPPLLRRGRGGHSPSRTHRTTLRTVLVLVVVALLISDICMWPTASAFRAASLSAVGGSRCTARRIVGAAASASMPASSGSAAGATAATLAGRCAANLAAATSTRGVGARRFGLGGGGFPATAATAGSAADVGMTGEEERRRDWEDRVVQWCLYRIGECNDVTQDVVDSWLDLVLDDEVLGKVRPDLAERLDDGPTFSIQTVTAGSAAERVLTLSEAAGTTCEERTAAVGVEMAKLRDDGSVRGWRDELYPVSTGFGRDPFFLVERAAAPHLGVRQYGPHINGYVRRDDGTIRMWMGRRAADKSKYPGMLDHVAAGGQPHGIGPMDNVVKECSEEAGIPEYLARRARPAGAVTYEKLAGPGGNQLDRNCLFCYDLELPADFVPAPVDGEVEEFFLWDLDQVAASLRPDFEDPIKPNCYLVVIDFLLRWGYITPESPGYLDVLRGLRSGPCS